MITQQITVALDSAPPYYRLKMHQGDSGRLLQVNIVYNDQPYIIQPGTTAYFQATKPDGKVVTRTEGVTVDTSSITVSLTSNILAAAGVMRCDIIMQNSDLTIIGTAVFEVYIEAQAVAFSSIASTDDFQSVAAAVNAAEGYRDEAQASSDSAAQSEAHVEQLAAEIEAVEYNPVRADATTNTLWNYIDGQWVDSGIGVTGTGDMSRSEYDQDDTVLNAGGIASYAMPKAAYDPTGAVAAAGGIPGYVSGWVTGTLANPSPSIFTSYATSYLYHPQLKILVIYGSITWDNSSGNPLPLNTVMFNISTIPGIVLPSSVRVLYDFGTVYNSAQQSYFLALNVRNGGIIDTALILPQTAQFIRFSESIFMAGWS